MTMFTASWWINVITPCTIIVTITYYFCVSTFKKWEKLNVPYIKPIPLFGNFLNVALGKNHPLEFYNKIYHEFAGQKYAGVFQMRTPYLMVRDPEIINDVMIKNFSSFPDRGIYSDFVAEPLTNNLLLMENPQWKIIRNKLTPAFTAGKLKTMYDQIKECGDELMKNIDIDLNRTSNEIEVKDIMGKYSTDVIGTCAFGLKLNAINDDESPFRKYGKLIFKPSLRVLMRELCVMITPALLKVVRLKKFPTAATDFFHAAFNETMTYRLENNIVRNDFVHYLMQARNDLVLNTDLPKHETLRKYPPLVALFRKASQTYRVPNSSLIIEKGQKIIIPIYAIHYDNKYYSDPEKFIPERFSAEEKAKRPSGVYLPFGDGPRICIGKRFAEMEIKLAFVEILTKFEVFPCEKTEIPLKYSKKVLTLVSKHGIWLRFKRIN
ncbi:probable cytochrome P450 6a13 isoform X2 [Acyrthosiphon pisum]|uniref:Cytochrome P450 n=1 Tax=Acyrthosiphon pisum TaxID=7029 RepID=A0A8R2H553_ACYPI|nr:probable cytochrome P450 6a13 isoform X2 [Acyrthosiphon pisum]|eukprot:XP_016660176.1 PREDICTED: probable cytochrome P450 6a13 isoform X2 [Acyrthosiphon pisum]